MVCSASGNVMWAPWVPNEEVECKRQGDLKVMAWCGLVNRRMVEVKWLVDKNGRPQLVTSER